MFCIYDTILSSSQWHSIIISFYKMTFSHSPNLPTAIECVKSWNKGSSSCMEGEDAWQLRRDGPLGCYRAPTRCPLEHGWVVTLGGVTECLCEGSSKEEHWVSMTSMMITGGSVRCSQEIWVSLSTAHDFITIFLCSLTFSLSLLPVYVIFSTGALGYFPSYTLGAMMAAQLYETAKKEIPELEKKIEKVW